MKKTKIGDCYHFGKELMIVDHFDDGIPYCIMDGKPEMMQVSDIPLPTLHLPIGNDPKKYGGAWFDMIRSGVKKEEYRDFLVWKNRLIEGWEPIQGGIKPMYTPFKVLHLTNGYGHHRPQLWAHIEGITIGRGNTEWGAPTDRDVFIIRLVDVFHTKNLKQ